MNDDQTPVAVDMNVEGNKVIFTVEPKEYAPLVAEYLATAMDKVQKLTEQRKSDDLLN